MPEILKPTALLTSTEALLSGKSNAFVDDRRAFSISDVKRITGLGKTAIYEALGKGLLRGRKYNARTLVLREDLEKFLANLKPYKEETAD